jgi:uncharacterized protein (TIRG00374 family)
MTQIPCKHSQADSNRQHLLKTSRFHNVKDLLKTSLRGVLIILVIIWLVSLVSSQELISALLQISSADLAILLIISVLLISVSVIKWAAFLSHLGIRPGFNRLFALYLVGYFVNVFTPSFLGGDLVRSLALGGNINRAHAISATVLERYTGIVAMLVMALVACFFSQVVSREIFFVVLVAVTGCITATILIAGGYLMRITEILPLPERVTKLIRSVHEGLIWGGGDLSLIIKALGWSFLFHLLTVINTAAVGIAVGWVEIPWVGLAVVVPLILIIGAVPISPQGLGIQEGAFVFFLHSVGATTGQALAIALVLRIKSYILALCGGAIWLTRQSWLKSSEKEL